MKPAPFDYARPASEDEALSLLARHGDDAVVLAGGLSLGAMLNMRLARPAVVIDINALPDFAGARLDDDELRTGALLRQADALASAEVGAAVPLLHAALPSVGHYQTRSRGTLAGSVAHADPSAEVPLCLATLGGAVELSSSRGRRRVPARDFARAALDTARGGDELVTALCWPAGFADVAFAELTQRHGDFAIVAAAAWARRAPGRGAVSYALGLGGVEDRPRVTEARETVDAAGADALALGVADAFAAELQPLSDPRAGADYRRRLAVHLGAAVLGRALARALTGVSP